MVRSLQAERPPLRLSPEYIPKRKMKIIRLSPLNDLPTYLTAASCSIGSCSPPQSPHPGARALDIHSAQHAELCMVGMAPADAFIILSAMSSLDASDLAIRPEHWHAPIATSNPLDPPRKSLCCTTGLCTDAAKGHLLIF